MALLFLYWSVREFIATNARDLRSTYRSSCMERYSLGISNKKFADEIKGTVSSNIHG
jgi:hypothetical protein